MRCDGVPLSATVDMTGYPRGDADLAGASERYRRRASLAHKDYSVPLHVDCSIEYELPDCAKPPQGVKIEPLLMIHPSHFRRLESMRRVPFVNNLPRASEAVPAPAAARAPRSARAPARRCCRAAPAPAAPAPALPAAAEYRLLLDDLLAHESRTATDWRERAPAAAVPLAREDYGAAAYRFESYPEYGYEGEVPCGAPCKASLGKLATRQRALKAHPYLAPEPGGPLDCDLSHTGIQGSATAAAYDRFDKRNTLPQLPIYI